jgi:hypothetical protein
MRIWCIKIGNVFALHFKSLQLIVENNFMHIDDMVYRQILGMAMGTKIVPTYPTNFSNACAKKSRRKTTFVCSTVKEKFGQNMEYFIENRGNAI